MPLDCATPPARAGQLDTRGKDGRLLVTLQHTECPRVGIGGKDVSGKFGQGPFSNGSTLNNVGTDTSNGGPISVTFFDNGDAATAPDTGSTFGLFVLALTALFGATRFRAPRLT